MRRRECVTEQLAERSGAQLTGLDGICGDVGLAEFNEMTVEARISVLDPLSREARDLRRFFFSGAAEADVDRSGRILVPATLARHAGLEREVVVTGNYDHLELWNPPAWEKHLNAVEGSVEHAAERLATHAS